MEKGFSVETEAAEWVCLYNTLAEGRGLGSKAEMGV
jgi:hypothetical protein